MNSWLRSHISVATEASRQNWSQVSEPLERLKASWCCVHIPALTALCMRARTRKKKPGTCHAAYKV